MLIWNISASSTRRKRSIKIITKRKQNKNTNSIMYSHLAKSYDELHRAEQDRKIRLVLASLAIKKTDKILDVGCGTALILDYLKDFKEYVGVDNSREMLEIAEKRKNKINGKHQDKIKNKNVKFILANAEKLPFRDGQFDIAVSITAVHNFSNPEKALDEIKRVVKSTAVITVLKKSRKFEEIRKLLAQKFSLKKAIEDAKDAVFVLKIKKG